MIYIVQTCLVLNWDQDKKVSSIEKGHASFIYIERENPHITKTI